GQARVATSPRLPRGAPPVDRLERDDLSARLRERDPIVRDARDFRVGPSPARYVVSIVIQDLRREALPCNLGGGGEHDACLGGRVPIRAKHHRRTPVPTLFGPRGAEGIPEEVTDGAVFK